LFANIVFKAQYVSLFTKMSTYIIGAPSDEGVKLFAKKKKKKKKKKSL
jgi:hypothetical protein